MQISSVNSVKFLGLDNENKENIKEIKILDKIKDLSKEKEYSKAQVGGCVLATALSASVLAGAIIRGKTRKIAALSETISSHERDISKLQERLRDALSIELPDIGKISEFVERLKSKILTDRLDYDIIAPTVYGKKAYTRNPKLTNYEDISSGTTIRIGNSRFEVPEISGDGRFHVELPTSNEVRITKEPMKDFTPTKNVSTTFSEEYAKSLQWDNDKIARDILQNFFDGHGQTLDGVKIDIVPTNNGNFRIRIDGKSEYTPDKAVFIGESSKKEDTRAAGFYGEGLKMASLKLLKDKGASEVNIGSSNWRLSYALSSNDLSNNRVLTYSLDRVEKVNGNYLEFETSDSKLVEAFKNTVNRFYHSGNEHFKTPDFENGTFGIKVLPNKNDKGAIYIAGQRFEFDGDYDGLKGAILYIKERPPKDVLDPSRDRVSLDNDDIEHIATWLAKKCTTTQDKMKVLKALDKYATDVPTKDESSIDKFLNKFIYMSDYGTENIAKAINFPEKYIAYSPASPEVVISLQGAGYRICKPNFNYLGMRTIHDLVGEARNHTPITPNETQLEKIKIIKEAIKELTPALKDKGGHFNPDELDTKIYLFDRMANCEDASYRNTKAEAIIDNGESKGFWIDKEYLDTSSFSDVLETALHELSHKVGGDETARFSYKLTDVNRDAIEQILTNSETKQKFQALSLIWNEL